MTDLEVMPASEAGAIREAIDAALDGWKHQSMIAQTAVVDLLLDLRSIVADG